MQFIILLHSFIFSDFSNEPTKGTITITSRRGLAIKNKHFYKNYPNDIQLLGKFLQ